MSINLCTFLNEQINAISFDLVNLGGVFCVFLFVVGYLFGFLGVGFFVVVGFFYLVGVFFLFFLLLGGVLLLFGSFLE